MSRQINLTLKKRENKKTIRTLFLISSSFFGFIFVISIISLVYNILLTNQLNDLIRQGEELNNNINKYSAKKGRILLVQERLFNIDKLLKDRKDPNQRVEAILGMVPKGIDIANVAASKDSMSLDVKSNNLYSLNELIDSFYNLSDKNKSSIKKVDLSAFNFDAETYNYRVSLNIDFIK